MLGPTVLLSGMHSGPNPSPGLGIARSLRSACPGLRLIGIDYSNASSGLHSDLVDEVICFPAWPTIDAAGWAEQISELLSRDDTVFIPSLDLEVHLLVDLVGPLDGLLMPGKRALGHVVKPAVPIADLLGLTTPPHELDTSWSAVELFLRRSPAGGWVKGPHYEAFRVRTALEALRAGEFVEENWGSGWHVEAHVPGQECGVVFCAREGRLLDAVLMEKTLLTADGKTWAGGVAELPPGLWGRLADLVEELEWTGGGEIELIRSWSGELVVMEVNPRFPAWVHGATVCGANLPHALVADEPRRAGRTIAPGFTRVVEEIAVSAELGLRPYAWSPGDVLSPEAKHPSGMRELMRSRNSASDPIDRGSKCAKHPLIPSSDDDRVTFPWAGLHKDTPYRELFPQVLTAQVEALGTALAGLPKSTLAYSVKTCPHPVLMRAARDLGLVAEAITLDELDAAASVGFDPARAILNGPAKWWPARAAVRCRAFFADSVAELESLLDRIDAGFDLTAEVVGLRLSALGANSRFGERFACPDEVRRAAEHIAALRDRLGAAWGISFHHAESTLGPARWGAEAAAALSQADALADLLGDDPTLVNLGGGWHPDDLPLLRPTVDRLLDDGPRVTRTGAAELVFEPGKLLTEAAGALVTRVLGRRGDDVVVDAALADIPEAAYRSHPVLREVDRSMRRVSRGRGRVLGRSCRENDVLAHGLDVSDLLEGDVLVFESCGAYDISMAYSFGRGHVAGGVL